ncbi:hypothetical protein Tco_1286600 [Tanacetum coccineum]
MKIKEDTWEEIVSVVSKRNDNKSVWGTIRKLCLAVAAYYVVVVVGISMGNNAIVISDASLGCLVLVTVRGSCSGFYLNLQEGNVANMAVLAVMRRFYYRQHSTTIVFENKDEQDEKADVDFRDIDFSKLNMGGGDGLDAEGNEDDSDIEEEAKEEEAIGKQEVVPPVSNQVDIIYSQY